MNGMGMGAQPSFAHILEECIEPVVSGAALHVGKLIAWCFIFRVTTQSCEWKRRNICFYSFVKAKFHLIRQNIVFFPTHELDT